MKKLSEISARFLLGVFEEASRYGAAVRHLRLHGSSSGSNRPSGITSANDSSANGLSSGAGSASETGIGGGDVQGLPARVRAATRRSLADRFGLGGCSGPAWARASSEATASAISASVAWGRP